MFCNAQIFRIDRQNIPAATKHCASTNEALKNCNIQCYRNLILINEKLIKVTLVYKSHLLCLL